MKPHVRFATKAGWSSSVAAARPLTVRLLGPVRARSASTSNGNTTNQLKSDASSTNGSAQDREELQLRAAAMANLQQQLAKVESLRAEELKTAISRFEELEEALSMAEKTILDLERENAAIKAAAKQELAESQSLVQKAMQVIEMLNAAGSDAEQSEATGSESDTGGDDGVEAIQGFDETASNIIEELEAELGQMHEIIASLSVHTESNGSTAMNEKTEKIEFEVPPMLSVSELESVVGKLTESQRNLAAAEKENAILRAKVASLERAEREASIVTTTSGKNSDKVYVRDLEARNRELAKLLGGSEAGLEEGVKTLRRVLERLDEEV